MIFIAGTILACVLLYDRKGQNSIYFILEISDDFDILDCSVVGNSRILSSCGKKLFQKF